MGHSVSLKILYGFFAVTREAGFCAGLVAEIAHFIRLRVPLDDQNHH